MSRTLLLQLARLGDLLQSLPVITSLQTHFPEQQLDLLCAAPLTPICKLFPGIQRIYPWEGERWHGFARMEEGGNERLVEEAGQYVSDFAFPPYTLAYNLNNHPRSILASHLLSARVVGAGDRGPLNPRLPPWVEFLQHVARERGANRIHLADAFCGLCGVSPPRVIPIIQAHDIELPPDLEQIVNDSSFVKIGIVLGAGDADRRVPLTTLCRLIEGCTDLLPNCLCVLIGGAGEREAALALEDKLSSQYLSRILNCVGRTTLPQLAHLFNRCQWVIGSDTGPLHLAVACGARAIGWYFSRARVHETGPYGVGHYVWQYRGSAHSESTDCSREKGGPHLPCSWPVLETLQIIHNQHTGENPSGWELWNSHHDEWGMFYTNGENSEIAVKLREEVWKRLSVKGPNHQEFSTMNAMTAG